MLNIIQLENWYVRFPFILFKHNFISKILFFKFQSLAMNRSFLYGIIVASSTWCFSLYLYWLLVQQQNSSQLTNNNEGERSEAVAKFQNINVNMLNGNQEREKSFFQDKLARYKKEQKFRKISQKLINEIKPVQQNLKDGGYLKSQIKYS